MKICKWLVVALASLGAFGVRVAKADGLMYFSEQDQGTIYLEVDWQCSSDPDGDGCNSSIELRNTTTDQWVATVSFSGDMAADASISAEVNDDIGVYAEDGSALFDYQWATGSIAIGGVPGGSYVANVSDGCGYDIGTWTMIDNDGRQSYEYQID